MVSRESHISYWRPSKKSEKHNGFRNNLIVHIIYTYTHHTHFCWTILSHTWLDNLHYRIDLGEHLKVWWRFPETNPLNPLISQSTYQPMNGISMVYHEIHDINGIFPTWYIWYFFKKYDTSIYTMFPRIVSFIGLVLLGQLTGNPHISW